jgi:hypothetical protein
VLLVVEVVVVVTVVLVLLVVGTMVVGGAVVDVVVVVDDAETYSAYTEIGPGTNVGGPAVVDGPSEYASQVKIFDAGVAPTKCTVAMLVSPVRMPSQYVAGVRLTGAASGSATHSPLGAGVTSRSGPVATSAPAVPPASR